MFILLVNYCFTLFECLNSSWNKNHRKRKSNNKKLKKRIFCIRKKIRIPQRLDLRLKLLALQSMQKIFQSRTGSGLVYLDRKLETSVNEVGHSKNINLLHLTWCQRGQANSDAARIHGTLVARTRVLVARDWDLFQDLLALAATQANRSQVDEEQMNVGTTWK